MERWQLVLLILSLLVSTTLSLMIVVWVLRGFNHFNNWLTLNDHEMNELKSALRSLDSRVTELSSALKEREEGTAEALEAPKVVVVGTGRSGSKFLAKVLTMAGVPCGHESWWSIYQTRQSGLSADSSWIAANRLQDFRGHVWHQVRHPLKVVRSLLGNQLLSQDCPEELKPYEQERRLWAGYEIDEAPELKALKIVAHWLTVCEEVSERTWRVEDMNGALLAELVGEFGVGISAEHCQELLDRAGTGVNKHPAGPELVWRELPECLAKKTIEEFAEKFGYELDDPEV